MRKLFGLLSLLVIASMVLSACGAAPAAAPMSDVVLATSIIPQDDVPANPRPEDLAPGKTFRGMTLEATSDPAWLCAKRCRSGLDETWITVRDFQVYWGKTTTLVMTPEDLLIRTKLGVEAAGFNPVYVSLEQIGGETLVVSPDMGISWDRYWEINVWDVNKATSMLNELKTNYISSAAERGLLFKGDVGTHQLIVTPNGRVVMIDYVDTLLVTPGTYGEFGSAEAYFNDVFGKLDSSFAADALYVPQRGQLVVATPIAPAAAAQPVVEVASGDLTDVAVMSKTTGDTTVVRLTAEEMGWLRGSDPRIIEVLARQGVALPKAPIWEIGVGGVLRVVEVGLVAVQAYLIYQTLQDVAGYGETVQVNVSSEDRVILGVEDGPHFQWILDHGLENSSLTQTYSWWLPGEVIAFFDNKPNTCVMLRIDEPSVVNLGQIFSGTDGDTITPIRVCTDRTNTVTYANLETGQTLIYTRNPDGVTWAQSGVPCSTFHTLVAKPDQSFYVSEVIEMCGEGDGRVYFTSTWWK